MLPILNIGPLAIQTPGVALFISLWLGLSLAEKHSSSHSLDPNHVYNLVAVALVAGIAGARLVYALRYPTAFIESPVSLISLNPSLLDLPGGAFTAIICSLVYAQRRNLAFWPTLDALTPLAVVLTIGLGVSHLASGSHFGIETNLPWAIELFGANRHPTQVYEILGALLILIYFWPGSKRTIFHHTGEYFLRFIACYAALRLLIEAFRADSALFAVGIRLDQILAMLVLVTCVLLLGRLPERAEPPVEPSTGSM